MPSIFGLDDRPQVDEREQNGLAGNQWIREFIDDVGLPLIIAEVGFDRAFHALKAMTPKEKWRERIAKEADIPGG